jgi:hypothetical protein
MLPAEGKTLEDIVRVVVDVNIPAFDHAKFEQNSKTWSGARQALAKKRPLNKLYRIVSDQERAGGEETLLYGLVVGYTEPERGTPAMCLVFVLGVYEGAGSYDTPLVVPADALEDVTEKARAGQLRFPRVGG